MATRRYETLDALRGVAALAVVVFHLTRIGEVQLMSAGYLAVDFFFALSGFVIALAYEKPLRSRMSWRAFFIKRAIRLYPLSVLGATLGLVVLLLKWHLVPLKSDPMSQILSSAALNWLLLPTFSASASSAYDIFPGDPPLWSLFFEMVVNLVWAWLGVRMCTRALAAVVLLSGAAMTAMSISFHTANLGFDPQTFWGGFVRSFFGFSLGVIIFRLRDHLTLGVGRFAPLLLSIVLLIILACPWNGGQHGVPWRDLISILVLLPMVVVLGIAHDGSGRLTRLLGALSYPIYVLHFPILYLISHLPHAALRHVHLLSLAMIWTTLPVAYLAMRYYDEPIRRWLSHQAWLVRADRREEGLSA